MAQSPEQASLADIVLEDEDLAGWLQQRLDNAQAAIDYRAAGKQIHEMLNQRYPNVINSDDDGEHTGYVRCGDFRFRPKGSKHEAGSVSFERGPGFDWQDMEIERLPK